MLVSKNCFNFSILFTKPFFLSHASTSLFRWGVLKLFTRKTFLNLLYLGDDVVFVHSPKSAIIETNGVYISNPCPINLESEGFERRITPSSNFRFRRFDILNRPPRVFAYELLKNIKGDETKSIGHYSFIRFIRDLRGKFDLLSMPPDKRSTLTGRRIPSGEFKYLQWTSCLDKYDSLLLSSDTHASQTHHAKQKHLYLHDTSPHWIMFYLRCLQSAAAHRSPIIVDAAALLGFMNGAEENLQSSAHIRIPFFNVNVAETALTVEPKVSLPAFGVSTISRTASASSTFTARVKHVFPSRIISLALRAAALFPETNIEFTLVSSGTCFLSFLPESPKETIAMTAMTTANTCFIIPPGWKCEKYFNTEPKKCNYYSSVLPIQTTRPSFLNRWRFLSVMTRSSRS